MSERLELFTEMRRDVFESSYLPISAALSLNPQKRLKQKHINGRLCFGGRFAFLFWRSFLGLRVRYLVYQLPKDWSIKKKKKVGKRRKFSVRLSLTNDVHSLDNKHVFHRRRQLLGLLLQANHSKCSFLFRSLFFKYLLLCFEFE